MNRLRLSLLIPGLLLLAAPLHAGEAEGPQPVVVTNFPEVQQVAGTVSLTGPIPATRFETNKGVVTTSLPTDVNSLIDGGTVEVSGFVNATLSLAVTVQGNLAAPGKVGALLVPDVPEILTAMRTFGVIQFPLTVEAPVAPSPSGVHQSEPVTVRLGFPRYRVFFYNTTPRSAETVLYTYLSNS